MKILKRAEQVTEISWNILSFSAIAPVYLFGRFLGWAFGMFKLGFLEGYRQSKGW